MEFREAGGTLARSADVLMEENTVQRLPCTVFIVSSIGNISSWKESLVPSAPRALLTQQMVTGREEDVGLGNSFSPVAPSLWPEARRVQAHMAVTEVLLNLITCVYRYTLLISSASYLLLQVPMCLYPWGYLSIILSQRKWLMISFKL